MQSRNSLLFFIIQFKITHLFSKVYELNITTILRHHHLDPRTSVGTRSLKRTIYRHKFNLSTKDPGTKNLGGFQNVLDGYVTRTRRHKQVDGRECGIRRKFSNGIGNTWQKIGCGNGKPRSDDVKWQIPSRNDLGNEYAIIKTTYQKLCNDHAIDKGIVTSSEHHHKNFRKNHATDNNNNNSNAGKVSFDRSRANNPDDTPFNPNGYCWTHGYCVHFNHSSVNCKYKA